MVASSAPSDAAARLAMLAPAGRFPSTCRPNRLRSASGKRRSRQTSDCGPTAHHRSKKDSPSSSRSGLARARPCPIPPLSAVVCVPAAWPSLGLRVAPRLLCRTPLRLNGIQFLESTRPSTPGDPSPGVLRRLPGRVGGKRLHPQSAGKNSAHCYLFATRRRRSKTIIVRSGARSGASWPLLRATPAFPARLAIY